MFFNILYYFLHKSNEMIYNFLMKPTKQKKLYKLKADAHAQ
jgi:hypothetical protein